MYKVCVFIKDITHQKEFADHVADLLHYSEGKWIGFSRGVSNEGTIYFELDEDVVPLQLCGIDIEFYEDKATRLLREKECGEEYHKGHGANSSPYASLPSNKYYTYAELKNLW